MANFVRQSKSGPRRRIFSNLARSGSIVDDDDNTAGWTTTVVDGKGAPATLPPHAVMSNNMDVGSMQLYSFYDPGLDETNYTATIKQVIHIEGAETDPPPLTSTKTFTVTGPRWAIDTSLVQSVYPPPGHADYATILPHVVFNDPHMPWMISMEASLGPIEKAKQDPSRKPPWLGLLVFEDLEITPSADQISSLQAQLTSAKSSTVLSQNPKSKAFKMQLADLVALDGTISQPVSANEVDLTTSVDVILISNGVFQALFAQYSGPPQVQRVPDNTVPDLTRFEYMSHVKNVNVAGLSDDNEVGQYAVTVSPRCGPLSASENKAVFAHLVSLENVPKRVSLQPSTALPFTALISLYNWSYSCIPQDKVSVYDMLRALGKNTQPLRVPDSLWNGTTTPSPEMKWATERLQAGYSLVRYRARTGEATLAVQRGPLTPLPVVHQEHPPLLPQSNFGSDLIILNKEFGIADLTYQLAWQLGRAVAMADRVFVGALIRLRSEIHEQALSAAKAEKATANKTFRDTRTVLQSFARTIEQLRAGHSQLSGLRTFDFTQRWRKLPLGEQSPRSLLSIKQADISQSYAKNVVIVASEKAQSTQAETALYNELNSPVSTDYATLLGWCLDRHFLQGIPYHNLFGDPASVPKESIRTFYVDDNWFDVFFDGALSLGNYYARGTDIIRSSVKAAFNTYLTTPINGYPPQIPRWGFILRSEIVAKFPDLVILAPWPDTTDPRAEVLRRETLDTDLLICLFDRIPDDGSFEGGITLRPPEHQLSFELDIPSTADSLTVEWKKVYADSHIEQDYSPTSVHLVPGVYNAKDVNTKGVFDFDARCLVFPHFANDASTAQTAPSWPGNPSSNVVGPCPALVGAQLLADIPELYFSGILPSAATANSLPLRQIATTVSAPFSGTASQRTTSAVTPPSPAQNAGGSGPPSPAVVLPARSSPTAVAERLNIRSLNALMETLKSAGIEPALSSSISPMSNVTGPVRGTSSSDTPSQLYCVFLCGSLSTLYPMSAIPSPSNNLQENGIYASNFFAIVGVPFPPLVDQGFSIIAMPEQEGWVLEYVEISIPVGSRPTDLFLPFQTGAAALEQVISATNSKPPVTDATMRTWNWPLKPSTSFSDLQLPIVEAHSRGERYRHDARYEPDQNAPPGCGSLIVRITPATSTVAESIAQNYDLSFLVQQPAINYAMNQKYTVNITEKYSSWPGSTTLSGIAKSTLVITGIGAAAASSSSGN